MIRLGCFTLLVLVCAPTFASPREPGFIFFGDWGQGNRAQKEVAAGIGRYCRGETCDFITALGDNFYPAGVASASDPQWQEKFHAVYDFLGLRFYAALGNHDYDGKPAAQIARSRLDKQWVLPTAYYEYSHGEVAFFVIDTNAFDSRQQRWLRQRLAASRSTWKIVYGHHPIYSTGHHGNTPALVRDLLPLLRGTVDFYLSGHDHDKESLQPIDGVHFLVSGAAAETRPVAGGTHTLYKNANLGFAHFLLKNGTVRIRFLDKNGGVEWEQRIAKHESLR